MRKIIPSFRRRPENKPKASFEERPSGNTKALRSKTCNGFDSLREGPPINWIPACAGMTAQRGFSIITAIFLLVVLSFLGIAMVSFSTSQHQSSAMDVMGSRAYQAARAGMEWAAFNVPQSSYNAGTPATCATSFAAGSLGGTLTPFAVTVSCATISRTEAGSTVWMYDITSTATTGGAPGDPGYVARVVSVKMGK